MKTNPSCTRLDCPREFPEKQNFCNICGAQLIAVSGSQQPQAEEDFYKTVVGSERLEGQTKETFSKREAGLQSEIDDVLQIPQEPLDPMKTMLGASEQSLNPAQEERIFDIPDSEELRMTSVGIEKPFGTPVGPSEPQITGEKKEFAPLEPPLTEFPFRQPDILGPNYPPSSEETLLVPQQEEREVFKKPESLSVSEPKPEELPETIVESSAEDKIFPPKSPYEPPSPFASPQTSYPETQTPFIQRDFAPEPTPFQPPTIFQSPFEESSAYKAQEQQMSWTPPLPPQSSWEDRPMGPGSAFTPPVSSKPDNTLAVISLVCGILSLFPCFCFTGIPAIITGFIAKNRATSQPHLYGGRGMAIAGIILGVISVVLTIIVFILYLLGIIVNLS